MRGVNRIPVICAQILTLWEKHPEQRLGQLLENYVFTQGFRGDKTSLCLFYQEDSLTLEVLKEKVSK
jgi:hypothetical protein